MDEREHWRQFGAWLEQQLLDRYPSKEEFAKAAGVSAYTVRDLVNGGRATQDGGWRVPQPFDSTLNKLAKALGMTGRELVDRAGGTYRARNPDKQRPPRPDADRLATLEERVRRLEEEAAELRPNGGNVTPMQPGRRRRSPG